MGKRLNVPIVLTTIRRTLSSECGPSSLRLVQPDKVFRLSLEGGQSLPSEHGLMTPASEKSDAGDHWKTRFLPDGRRRKSYFAVCLRATFAAVGF